MGSMAFGRKAAVALGVILAGAAMSTAAMAVPIAAGSTLSLNGTDTFTATSVTFDNPANIGGQSGSFSVLANCTGCVTMTSFTSATATPFTMYTATEGAISTSLSASSTSFAFTGGALPSLTVTGAGTLTLTGFDPTPGTYILTTQGPTGVSVTFSVTSAASAVPEPLSLALFGTGLLALGVAHRKRAG